MFWPFRRSNKALIELIRKVTFGQRMDAEIGSNRSRQTVALLTAILPKKDLDKKVSEKQISDACGTNPFPSGLFNGKDKKTTIRKLLQYIDP